MTSSSDTVQNQFDGSDSAATLVRPLGAFERMYCRAMETSPMHFSVGAEFAVPLEEEQVRVALAAVQKRHPLLSVHVEDHPGTRLGFYRAATVPAVGLTVLRQEVSDWPKVAGTELSHRIDASKAPLVRAVLISDATSSMILLTFHHAMSDGMSGVYMLRDLVAALNGHRLEPLPVPPSQEELIERVLPSQAELPPGEPEDPRMASPGIVRPFDGSVPDVSAITLDANLTSRIVERCRTERTTVHGLITAAASRVRSTLRGEDFVRVATPFDLRRLIGAGDDVGFYVAAARTGTTPHGGAPLWDQARAVSEQVTTARSAAGVVAMSTAIQQFVPIDTDSDTALTLMSHALAFELVLSNLGVLEFDSTGPIHPTAIWGPFLLFQSVGEEVSGITTFEGRMRIVTCGHEPTEKFSDDLRRILTEAVR